MREVKTTNIMHVFICVNERESKDSCAPTISLNDYSQLKKWAKDEGLVPNIFITKTGCLGFCNPVGGTIVIYPQKKFFFEIQNLDEIKKLILEEYNKIKSL